MIGTEIHLKWEITSDGGSLTQQISGLIRQAIQDGSLRSGDRIPPTRHLANDLRVSRGTVTTAVELLIAEGLLETRTGSGTYVSQDATLGSSVPQFELIRTFEIKDVPRPDRDLTTDAKIDFTPCRPSLEIFPMNVWRRCVSLASSALPSPDYDDPQGNERLRIEISEYLRRARGLTADPSRIMITNGATHAMHMLTELLVTSKDQVVFEDPGYPLARQIFTSTGARLHFCDVDENGLVTDQLPLSDRCTKLVYTTPSHQFPLGSRLSLRRRHELLTWATENGALIVEDDYDGEYRYDVPPLAPMAVMAPDLVAYCGTFSKTMFPGVRVGYVVAPKHIIKKMAWLRKLTGYAQGALTQTALATFIAQGHFERHVHRMRRIYAEKRRTVLHAIATLDIEATIVGLDSGLSVVVQPPQSLTDKAIVKRGIENDVFVIPVSRYRERKRNTENSLVIGYSALTHDEIESGIYRLLVPR